MEPPRTPPTPPQGNLPAVPPQASDAGGALEPLPPRYEPPPFEPPRYPPPLHRPPSAWSRFRLRNWRGAVGLGLAGAAVLLFPFLDDPGRWWVPVAAGLGTLILLVVLRLDRLLRGWTWHLAGLALVVGLMFSTGPWAWAMAASIGVLIAGLLRLPAWKLLAVGVVLCAGSGLGYGLSTVRTTEQVEAQQVQTHLQSRGQLGAPRPTAVLPVLLNSIARGDTGAICDNLLAEPAQPSFAASAGQPDCAAAVQALAARVTDPSGYARATAESTSSGDVTTVDACHMTWDAAPAGPQLGRLTVGRTTGSTYVVTGFAPC
ncbi:hypothetical protein [Pseudonocardia acidicola]|uniref:Uncharacterized protein n=1 Tax=Pseudonocardia acidicola TaxID=2724939 RepID=A0ABX1SCV7_9PSEU|nr:hypothetical protein [Pseudonocardia acidicola]NMH98925.1 hypothetical protein [Pseudonocardia acidicola]